MLQTLDKLTQQGGNLVITAETATVVETMINVCGILAESAEAVAEGTADPTARDAHFNYAKRIRGEIPSLQTIVQMIQANPKNAEIKSLLINTAKNIATYTSEMIAGGESELQNRLVNSCKECAQNAKSLLINLHAPYETFFGFCKGFAASAMTLTTTLQEIARKLDNPSHQQKVVVAYNSIKEVSPVIIRAAKKAYEQPDNTEFQEELQLAVKSLAQKITYSLSVGQVEGHREEISKNQAVVSLPKVDLPPAVDDSAMRRSRKKTVKTADHGHQILKQAKTASVAKRVEDELDEGSLIGLEVLKRKAPAAGSNPPALPDRPPPISLSSSQAAKRQDEVDALENSFNEVKIEEGDWKGKYEGLKQKYDALVKENEALKAQLSQKK